MVPDKVALRLAGDENRLRGVRLPLLQGTFFPSLCGCQCPYVYRRGILYLGRALASQAMMCRPLSAWAVPLTYLLARRDRNHPALVAAGIVALDDD